MKIICLLGKLKLLYVINCFICLSLSQPVSSQTPILSFNPVITAGLSSPLDIVNAGDGTNRLFIVEQGGIIKYSKAGLLNDTVFLDIHKKISTGGERGLLSLAFHPQYQTNGYFFVYYTDVAGNIAVERYHVSADRNKADSLSGQVLLNIPHTEFSNHNGGKLNFGADGHLYFATGDGGFGGDPHFNSQKGQTLLGKMIRINVDRFATGAPFYDIPQGNPYASTTDGIMDEIWAFGLRNPFRWSFDKLTHDMWIGDVGQGAREEINFQPASNPGGMNYGWRCYEGTLGYRDSGCQAASNYNFPVFDYDRSIANGGTTVIGGIVYRGSAFPSLYGWYVCIDLASRNGWLIKPNGSGGWNAIKQSGLPTLVAGFGEDEQGELFAAGLNGTVYRVQASASGPLPVLLQSFNAVAKNGLHEITWRTASEQHLRQFEVQYSANGTSFQTIAIVPAANANNGKEYRVNSKFPISETSFYRLKIVNHDYNAEYSAIVQLTSLTEKEVTINPTLVKNETISIRFRKPFRSLQVIDMKGRVLKSKNLSENTNTYYLEVSGLAPGIYIIKMIGNHSQLYRKIVIQ